MLFCRCAIILIAGLVCSVASAEEPPLPGGLEPQTKQDTPGSESIPSDQSERTPHKPAVRLAAIWDSRVGQSWRQDNNENRTSLTETRLQLNFDIPGERQQFHVVADLLYDNIEDQPDIDLEHGGGFIDLREVNVLFRPGRVLTIKAGRQILTWGTGDLVFINDLFPKDARSLFLGRHAPYLKAPSDAIKFTLLAKPANLDLVYTPRFDSDRFIDGSRISFYNSELGRLSASGEVTRVSKPDRVFEDHEIALRLYRNLSAYELALYAYQGFWKSPAGSDPRTGKAVFPRLGVYGASVRGAVGDGVGNMELGIYDSMDDPDGDDPLIKNSEAAF